MPGCQTQEKCTNLEPLRRLSGCFYAGCCPCFEKTVGLVVESSADSMQETMIEQAMRRIDSVQRMDYTD